MKPLRFQLPERPPLTAEQKSQRRRDNETAILIIAMVLIVLFVLPIRILIIG